MTHDQTTRHKGYYGMVPLLYNSLKKTAPEAVPPARVLVVIVSKNLRHPRKAS